VTFDGDTLGFLPGATIRGDIDIAVGPHAVAVRAPGYRDLVEEVTITPGVHLERPYTLAKRRDTWWYASRIGAVVGLTSLGIAMHDDKGSQTNTPLAEPPPPPSSGH